MLLNPNPWWSHLPTNQLNEEEEGFFMVVQKDSFQHSVCGVLEVGPAGHPRRKLPSRWNRDGQVPTRFSARDLGASAKAACLARSPLFVPVKILRAALDEANAGECRGLACAPSFAGL